METGEKAEREEEDGDRIEGREKGREQGRLGGSEEGRMGET